MTFKKQDLEKLQQLKESLKKMEEKNERRNTKEALSLATNNSRCGLGISMGVGKTRIAIQHLMKNYDPFIRALVVVPKKSIMESWIDELRKMSLTDKLSSHIEFVTYLSLNKKNPNDYDIVYLDECHSLLDTHKTFLSEFKGKILGLTGTPPRKGTEKYNMVNKYCPIVYNYSVDQATDSKILNDYKIIVHELQLSKLKTHKRKVRMVVSGILQNKMIIITLLHV